MKKHFIVTIALILAFGLMQSTSFADKGKGHNRGKDYKESIDKKFFKKVKMIYRYQDELNINEEQIAQIKKLKIALKKDLIRSKADIDIIGVDIRSSLYVNVIDVEAVDKLIDQKYEIKKARMKNAIKSYAQLKKILTKEQIKKLKGIIGNQKKMHMSKGSPKKSR